MKLDSVAAAWPSTSYLLPLTLRYTKMATVKLRKTFRYPSDDSDEDKTPQALDEEGVMKSDKMYIGNY